MSRRVTQQTDLLKKVSVRCTTQPSAPYATPQYSTLIAPMQLNIPFAGPLFTQICRLGIAMNVSIVNFLRQ